ncbi:unnamed protein product [Rhizophagus irregularis]|nr:unnamed protein product [Rhizophagus irregularis]
MDLELVKVKGHSGDVMNEMVDELAKNTSNNSCYFNNRFSYSSRTVRFFPIFKQIPIEYNLRKFIKTLMNAKVTAEWSMLKTNGHEIPIAWNIICNLIHKYKGFNCISVKKHCIVRLVVGGAMHAPTSGLTAVAVPTSPLRGLAYPIYHGHSGHSGHTIFQLLFFSPFFFIYKTTMTTMTNMTRVLKNR